MFRCALIGMPTCRQQRYVGTVSYISVDQVSGGRKGIVVASETGVLAVLNPEDGSISKLLVQ